MILMIQGKGKSREITDSNSFWAKSELVPKKIKNDGPFCTPVAKVEGLFFS